MRFLCLLFTVALVAQTPQPYIYRNAGPGDCQVPGGLCYGVGLVIPRGSVVTQIDLNGVIVPTQYWTMDPTGNMAVVKMPFAGIQDTFRAWY